MCTSVKTWVLLYLPALLLLGTVHAAEPGRVAVLKDDLPRLGAPSSPDWLATALRQAEFEVAFVDGQQLEDAHTFNRDRFDVVVLPYGPCFPVGAANNFRRFLRAGGKFLSTGGYAFDRLVERTPRGWEPPSPPRVPEVNHVIWRYAIPASELAGHGRLTFSGWLTAENVRGPGMAFFAIYQIAADGTFPEWKDLCRVTGSRDWQEIRYRFDVHPRAVTVELRAGLFQCHGSARFDDIRLTDAANRAIVESDFEPAFDPDASGSARWVRSDPQRCAVATQGARSGQRALEARLEYEVLVPERLNTRHGTPADGLDTAPTQLGVFQPDYRLERVHSARAAPDQVILEPGLIVDGPLEGHAASGVVGFNQARWVPLLNAYDRYGRLRGAAGAMLRHFAGPYAGSSWAFFGVTNRDLFAPSDTGTARAFVQTVRALVEDTYLAALVPEPPCARPGEPVDIVAVVVNGGRQPRTVQVRLDIYEGELAPEALAARPRPLTTLARQLELVTGRTNVVRFRWQPGPSRADFYHLVGRLALGGTEMDRLESGLVVWNDQVVADGPRLSFRDNYLRVGRRPVFMFGTDDWGYVFNTLRETPLQWRRDMRQRRDFGVTIYENLQVGLPATPAELERLWPKVDGLVQLAQQYQQVYFPCLLCGFNVAASDAELERHRDYCRAFAQRYGNVPGLIYYLNGDLRCQLSDAVTPHWNEFLRARHGTVEALRQAWGRHAPSAPLGQIPADDFDDWGHPWDEGRIVDQNRFRAWLIRRWCGTLIDAIREHDAVHPTTAEFYQLPHQGVDVEAGIGALDLANFGYFDRPGADLDRFPAICKFNDLRARGRSVGPGEYGVKTHPAWGDGGDYGYHIARTPAQALELFLGIAHYSLGLGASRIHNWCWKDDAHRVFPWGMVYPCDNVPKDISCVHRNQSLLFRQFAPVYRAPSVHVLIPDEHRFGGGKWPVIEGVLHAFALALATHVENLGTLHEADLRLSPADKVVFYPIPYCPPDAVFARLRAWVQQGGVLYLSGDLSYDDQRQRTRTRRLEDLCGVRFVAEQYPNIAVNPAGPEHQPCIRVEPAGARVLETTADGLPLLVEHPLGRGRVFFTTDPIELHPTPARRSRDVALYRRVLEAAGVRPIGLELNPTPSSPSRADLEALHAFRLPLADGGCVYVLFNTKRDGPALEVTLTDLDPPVSLSVAAQRPALLWLDGRRALRALESQGLSRVGDQPLLRDDTHGIVVTLDRRDLRQSRALVLMPLQPGRVGLPLRASRPSLALETGDLHDGAWRTLATAPLASDLAPRREIDVSPDQALSLLLVAPSTELPRWRSAVSRLARSPAP